MAMTSNMLIVTTVAALALISPAFSENINITSPPVTDWGDWGNMVRCPAGRYAQGFQLKTEPNQGLFNDDTALNAIRLFCGDPYYPDTAVVSSSEGDFGNWGRVYTCFPGVLNGFQLRVLAKNDLDDMATTNIRYFCSSLSNPNDYIEGDGLGWGNWGSSQHCYGGQGICGIQTQVQPWQRDDDDTALNNVRFECCDSNGSSSGAAAEEKTITVKDLNIWGALPFHPKFIPLVMKNIEQFKSP